MANSLIQRKDETDEAFAERLREFRERRKEYARRWREAHRDRYNDYMKRYQAEYLKRPGVFEKRRIARRKCATKARKDPEKYARMREQCRLSRLRHPETYKAYYEKNKEHIKRRIKRWRTEHAEHVRELQRAWNRRNPERYHYYAQMYRITHPEEHRRRNRRWRERHQNELIVKQYKKRALRDRLKHRRDVVAEKWLHDEDVLFSEWED